METLNETSVSTKQIAPGIQSNHGPLVLFGVVVLILNIFAGLIWYFGSPDDWWAPFAFMNVCLFPFLLLLVGMDGNEDSPAEKK